MPSPLPLNAPRTESTAQLVVTLGPASLDRAAALAAAGATSFRLNASHMTPATLRAALDTLAASTPEMPVVVDLQGAKMRFGTFAERTVRPGERLVFALDAHGQDAVPLPHPEFFRAAGAGDTLTGDDGRMRFRVLAVEPSRMEVEVLAPGGVLRPRKGVNLMDHPVRLDRLTDSDLALCDAAGAGVAYAFSFMEDGHEARWLCEPPVRGCLAVVVKVERREAVESIDSIARAVDAIWICRGDLGEQLGLAELARFVSSFDPRRCEVPVLMAGQVLQHLTEHAEPTRSEVCHLYDLLARGHAGIVLSDETAVGREPERAVRIAADLLCALPR